MLKTCTKGLATMLALCALTIPVACGPEAPVESALLPQGTAAIIPTASRGPTLLPMAVPTLTTTAMEVTIDLGGELPADGGAVLPPEALPMQTYHDPCYGYSISYPSQCWLVSRGDQGEPERRLAIAGLGAVAAGIAVAPEPQMTLDQVAAEWKNKWESQGRGELEEEKAVINGCDAWIATGATGGTITMNVFVVHNQMRYELAFATSHLFYSEVQPLIQAIAGSLVLSEPQLSSTQAPLPLPPPPLWEMPGSDWCQVSVPARANLVSVSQSRVVWSGPSEPGSYLADRVSLYDLTTGQAKEIVQPTREGGQVIPARVSGDWVTWMDYQDIERGSDWILFALNLKSGDKRVVAENDGTQKGGPAPSIQGERIVWKQPGKDASGRDAIRIYDLTTAQTVTLRVPSSHWLAWPAVYGDTVVYVKGEQAQDNSIAPRDVYAYDLRTHTEHRLSKSGKASQPAVWGDYVIWLEDYLDDEMTAGLGSNVFLHRLATGQTQQLTRGAIADLPSIGDRFVTWNNVGGPVIAYDLAENRLIMVDQAADGESVGGAYTSEGTLAWYWMESNAADSQQKTEIRVIAPCAH